MMELNIIRQKYLMSICLLGIYAYVHRQMLLSALTENLFFSVKGFMYADSWLHKVLRSES